MFNVQCSTEQQGFHREDKKSPSFDQFNNLTS